MAAKSEANKEGREMSYQLELPENFIAGTIVADPPWPLDQPNTMHSRRRVHYERMSIDEICAIPVDLVAHPDAHLWLWSTNPHLEKAFQVIRAWGFTYRTMATWQKSKIGLGWWLRSQTEQLLFSARTDKLRHNPGNFTTVLKGSWRGHSRKPDEAYEMIEALSPPPYLELFASPESEPRKNWYRLAKFIVPDEPFGQLHKRKNGKPDPGDGIVRGVGGLEIHPDSEYVWLTKVFHGTPVRAIEQKARRVKIELPCGTKKSVSIDSLRPADYEVPA